LVYRSHNSRSFRAARARHYCRALGFAFALAAMAGCQNNSERDLIARDRRMQEDQIYALQDYVNQYQQLLCRYRTENNALRQQMSQGYIVEPQPSDRRMTPDTSRIRNGGPAPNVSPRFQEPRTPSDERPSQPATQPEIDVPDVPPLKSTTSSEVESPDASQVQLSEADSHDVATPRVLTAAHEEPAPRTPVADEAATPEASAPAAAPAEPIVNSPSAPHPPASDILLSGEVVANEDGGGPRLVVDVEPFDFAGRVESFTGSLSLMLLARDGDGRPHNLGRWNYNASQVRDAINPQANEPTMRFFIELPTDSPVVGPTELWVRMVSPDGARRLAHAKIELSQPGVFSSRANKLWAAEEAVVAASYSAATPPATDVAAVTNEGGWSVAEPGKPANLPAGLLDESGGGRWRASSEPMPAIIATSTPAPPSGEMNNPLRPIERSPVSATTEPPAKRPAWAPDRESGPSRRVGTRPSWSATR
jgi:hypothetical protein